MIEDEEKGGKPVNKPKEELRSRDIERMKRWDMRWSEKIRNGKRWRAKIRRQQSERSKIRGTKTEETKKGWTKHKKASRKRRQAASDLG